MKNTKIDEPGTKAFGTMKHQVFITRICIELQLCPTYRFPSSHFVIRYDAIKLIEVLFVRDRVWIELAQIQPRRARRYRTIHSLDSMSQLVFTQ